MLLDTHVHLASFNNIAEIIENAKKNQINAIIAVGGNLESSIKTLEIAQQYPGYVFPGIGLHPSEILKEKIQENLRLIKEKSSEAVCIGEIGLDYSYSFAQREENRELQRKFFKELLIVARNVELPVSLHSRSAYSDSLQLLLKYGPERAVFHWYDGPIDLLQEILDEGFYVSATPALEYSKEHRLVFENTPLDRILVETDSPIYLRSLKRRSEPSDVLLTIKELALLKGQDLEETIKVTGNNALKLFDKIKI